MARLSRQKYRQAYKEYINSPVWKERRERYFSTHEKVCRACGGGNRIHLHHQTYERFGAGGEWDRDLVPLCFWCHQEVHKYHKKMKRRRGGMVLSKATSNVVKAIQKRKKE